MHPVIHHGRVITDGEIEAMADEAEAGYDLSRLNRLPGFQRSEPPTAGPARP